MEKFKYYLCIIIWTFMPKTSLAEDIELSDNIKAAREAQIQVAKSQIQQNMAKTKEAYSTNEQTAAEKLNPEEIIKQNTTK